MIRPALLRWSLLTLLCAFFLSAFPLFAQNPAAHKAQLEQDELALQAHTLTLDEITRLMQANYAFSQAEKAEPSLRGSLGGESGDDQQTLDQMSGKIGSSPKAVAILSEHGFTPKQFAVATMSMVQSALAVFALESGASLDKLKSSAHVNPANIKLLQDHKAEIEALRAKYPTES